MTAQVALIVRHPIKSVGYEVLAAVDLSAGSVLPGDRCYAVAHDAAKFAGQPTEWQAKANFLRGVACPDLMAVQAATEADGRITLTHPHHPPLTVDPLADSGALVAWLRPMWPDNRPAPSHVVAVAGQAMTDVPDPWIAVASNSTLRALAQRMGTDLSPHRFRANIWVDGWPVQHERDLIGQRITLGQTTVEVMEPITRCRATCANPVTGQDDADTLAALNTAWGHQDFGVYARVITGGRVALGDQVTPA